MPLFRKSDRRQVIDIPVKELRPNPHQPRRAFDREGLEELSRSIASVGILQPLSVRRAMGGWELVAGERRLRAAQLAGLTTVPCLPVEADEETSSLLALIENLQRRDLDVWEEGRPSANSSSGSTCPRRRPPAGWARASPPWPTSSAC